MKKFKLKFIIPMVIFFQLPACLGGIGDECKNDSDCRSGLVCFIPQVEICGGEWQKGTCRRPCKTDNDCRDCEADSDCSGPVCVMGGACFEEPPPIISCDASSDTITEDIRPDQIPDIKTEDEKTLDVEVEREIPEDCFTRDLTPHECNLPNQFENILKATSFRVGENGHPGSGLNLDNNIATCSPGANQNPPLCSDGIDNAMALLGIMGNPSLDIAITDGTMNILIQLSGFNDSGCPFYVDFLKGILISGTPGCVNEPDCTYAVSTDSFDSQNCFPISFVGNAFMDGNRLTAGGEEFIYYFDAIVVGLHIVIPVLRPEIEAQIEFEGNIPKKITGILGGYIKEEDFIGAFESIPEENYPPGISKDDIIQLWRNAYSSGQIEKDMDLDNDGTAESSSIGILFEAIPVLVHGIS